MRSTSVAHAHTSLAAAETTPARRASRNAGVAAG